MRATRRVTRPWLQLLPCSGARTSAILGFLLGLLLTPGPVEAQRLAFEHERDVGTSVWTSVPTWSGSSLLWYEDNQTDQPLIDAVDRNGLRDRLSLDIPKARLIQVNGVGGGADGSIVVAGFAISGDSRGAPFLAWISPDRQRQVLIQTLRFFPWEAVVAADGVIWAGGLLWDGTDTGTRTWNVVQRYDTSGRMLSSYTLPAPVNELLGHPDPSRLLASRDRVGWFTNAAEYIEFALDGTELRRVPGPPATTYLELAGVALSSENHLVLARRGGDVLALDRATLEWYPLTVPSRTNDKFFGVLGFDGATLVAYEQDGVMRRFTSAPAAVPKPAPRRRGKEAGAGQPSGCN